MNNYKYEEQSGRSMIEMLGVLAIIGVLSVGGIAGYSKAMNKFKTNKVADNVSMLVANIKTLYAQQKNYDELDNAAAISMGVVPDELISDRDNAELLNAFNGNVDIHVSGSTSADGSDKKAFVISFGSLSREACITLATNDWGSGYSSGLIAIRASATSEDAALDKIVIGDDGDDTAKKSIATPGGETLAVPMNVVKAAAACGCTSGNTCSIQWKYY